MEEIESQANGNAEDWLIIFYFGMIRSKMLKI